MTSVESVLFGAKYVPSGCRPIGGVQSWIATLRAEFERRGIRCAEFEPGSSMPVGSFDLGILSNVGRLHAGIVGRCARTVSVSHGIIPDERPLPCNAPQLFVSENVRSHWGGADSDAIIRQPIDLAFWRPADGRRVLAVRFSYRRSDTLCRAVAQRLGLSFVHVHDAAPVVARETLQSAAVVFASGRAALEAMACGAPVVVYDHRSAYQGPLLDIDLPRQIRNSYSGRGGIEPSLQQVCAAAESAMAGPPSLWRSWVRMHHDVRRIATELLS